MTSFNWRCTKFWKGSSPCSVNRSPPLRPSHRHPTAPVSTHPSLTALPHPILSKTKPNHPTTTVAFPANPSESVVREHGGHRHAGTPQLECVVTGHRYRTPSSNASTSTAPSHQRLGVSPSARTAVGTRSMFRTLYWNSCPARIPGPAERTGVACVRVCVRVCV